MKVANKMLLSVIVVGLVGCSGITPLQEFLVPGLSVIEPGRKAEEALLKRNREQAQMWNAQKQPAK